MRLASSRPSPRRTTRTPRRPAAGLTGASWPGVRDVSKPPPQQPGGIAGLLLNSLTVGTSVRRARRTSRAVVRRRTSGRPAIVGSAQQPPGSALVAPLGRVASAVPSARATSFPRVAPGPQSRYDDDQGPDRARQPRPQPSPLVAALVQAVIEQHAKRAGVRPDGGAMSNPMERDHDIEAPARATNPGRPPLAVIADGHPAVARP